MNIYNRTKKIQVANDCQELSSFWDKALGLLNKNHSRALYFQTRFGIHTFGLKEPIDVIVLDNIFKVAKLKTVSPNRLFFWNPKYSKVLELPNGMITETHICYGDCLEIRN